MEHTGESSPKSERHGSSLYRPDTLCDKIYFRKHYTAVVRIVGYRTWTREEVRQALEPLLEPFGKDKINAATEDLLTWMYDTQARCDVLTLSDTARKWCVALLGPPPVKIASDQSRATGSARRDTTVASRNTRRARSASHDRPPADSDDEDSDEADTGEDEPIEETTESETPGEDHILLTPATEAIVEGEPVNLPRETVLERFVAALDAIDQDFTLPTDEIKAELGGEHLGTLDYFVDESNGGTELVTVRPRLTEYERREMLAWVTLFEPGESIAVRVWPQEMNGRWTWYWHPIEEDTGKEEPNGTLSAERDESQAVSNSGQAGNSQPENSESLDKPDGDDIPGETSIGDDEPDEEWSEPTVSRERHVIITPSTASDIEGQPVRLPREVVVTHFSQTLDARGVIYNAKDERISEKLGGGRLDTLDYFVYECDDTELVTIRPSLTDDERRTMLTGMRLFQPEVVTAFRVWPHEEDGRWTWYWYPVEETSTESLDSQPAGAPSANVERGDPQKASGDPARSDSFSTTPQPTERLTPSTTEHSDGHSGKNCDLKHVSHRLDLLQEDLETFTEKHWQEGEVLQALHDEFEAIRWQVEQATKARPRAAITEASVPASANLSPSQTADTPGETPASTPGKKRRKRESRRS